jgi:hypothetical protein
VVQTPSIVVKNKNQEGGLGIFFYKNALVGGDWIIQERLENSDFLKLLLPDNAPLSTLRVITASRGGLTPEDPRGGLSADDAGFNKGAGAASVSQGVNTYKGLAGMPSAASLRYHVARHNALVEKGRL